MKTTLHLLSSFSLSHSKPETRLSSFPTFGGQVRGENPKLSHASHSSLKTQNSKLNTSLRAFTLLELLIVISVIAILMGLLFPAIGGVKKATKINRAKMDITQIAGGLRSYYNEYGTWPAINNSTPVTDKNLTADQLKNLYLTLSGNDFYLDGTPGSNPRRIVFTEFKSDILKPVSTTLTAGVYPPLLTGATTNLVDPWGASYMIAFDADADNKTYIYGDTAATPSTTYPQVVAPVAIWSAGPDKKLKICTTDADVKDELNKDNIVSWK